jgi:hypothetical protein
LESSINFTVYSKQSAQCNSWAVMSSSYVHLQVTLNVDAPNTRNVRVKVSLDLSIYCRLGFKDFVCCA